MSLARTYFIRLYLSSGAFFLPPIVKYNPP
jgi:hypothetical protein